MYRYLISLLASLLFTICLLGQSERINLDSLLTYEQSTLDSLVNDYYTHLDIKDTFDLFGLIDELTFEDHYNFINFDSIIQNIDWNKATKKIDWNTALRQFDWNQMLDAMCNAPDSLYEGSPLNIDLSNTPNLPSPTDFLTKVDLSKCIQLEMNNPATMQKMFQAMDMICLMNKMYLLQGDSLGNGLPFEILGKMQGNTALNGTPNLDLICPLLECLDMNIMMEDFDFNCMFQQVDFNVIMRRWKLSDYINSLDSIKLNQGADTLINAMSTHPLLGMMNPDSIAHYFSSPFEDFFDAKSTTVMNQNFYDRIFGDNWLPQKDEDIRNILELATPIWPQIYGDNINTRYLSSALWLFYEVQLAYNQFDYSTALSKQLLLKDIVIQMMKYNVLNQFSEGGSPVFHSEQMLWSMLVSVEQLIGNTLSELGQHTNALTHFEVALTINKPITTDLNPQEFEQNYFTKEFTEQERQVLLKNFKIDRDVLHLSMDDLLKSKHPKIVQRFIESGDTDKALTCYYLLKDLLLEAGPKGDIIPSYLIPNPAANKPYELLYIRRIHQKMAGLLQECNQEDHPKYTIYKAAATQIDYYQQYLLTTFYQNNLGTYYFQLNNYELSLRHLLDAWDRIKNTRKLDYIIAARPGFGTIENAHQNQIPTYIGLIANIGQIYLAQKEYQQAIDFLKEARAHLRKYNNHPTLEKDLFDIYTLEARIHFLNQNWAEGKRFLDKCNAIAKTSKYQLRQFQMTNYWGHYYSGLNRLDSALIHWQKAKKIALNANHTNVLSAIHGLIGKAYFRQNMPQLALNHLDTGTVIAKERAQFDVLNQLYSIRGQYYLKNQNFPAALSYFEQAITIIEDSLFHHTLSESSRQLTIENSFSAYEGAIEAAIELKKYDKAFQFVQQAKSRTLLELLSISSLKGNKIPEDLKVQKQDLATEININHQLLSIYPDSQQIQIQLRNLLSQMKIVNASIRAASPAYAQLMQPDLATISMVQNQLQAQQAFVDFFYGEVVHAFVLTKKGFVVLNFGERAMIEKELSTFVSIIDNPQVYEDILLQKRLEKISKKLQETLLTPILSHSFFKNIDELIIAPDNSLYLMPFELLLAESPDSNTAYVLQNLNISYTQSASTLTYYQLKQQQQKYIKDMLVIGKSDFSEYPQLDNLKPFNTSIFNIPDVEFILGKDATLATFQQQNISDYRYLYFKTHSVLNPRPELSFLALTDNPLFVYQTFDMDFNNQLIILSACQTGRGTFQRGGGIMGFTRGFQNAGAQSVIISLWPVADKATEAFFKEFFNFIQQGLSDKKALQAAKVKFSKSGVYTHPIYWAGFVLFGGN